MLDRRAAASFPQRNQIGKQGEANANYQNPPALHKCSAAVGAASRGFGGSVFAGHCLAVGVGAAAAGRADQGAEAVVADAAGGGGGGGTAMGVAGADCTIGTLIKGICGVLVLAVNWPVWPAGI